MSVSVSLWRGYDCCSGRRPSLTSTTRTGVMLHVQVRAAKTIFTWPYIYIVCDRNNVTPLKIMSCKKDIKMFVRLLLASGKLNDVKKLKGNPETAWKSISFWVKNVYKIILTIWVWRNFLNCSKIPWFFEWRMKKMCPKLFLQFKFCRTFCRQRKWVGPSEIFLPDRELF